jgi:hypothetical protein
MELPRQVHTFPASSTFEPKISLVPMHLSAGLDVFCGVFALQFFEKGRFYEGGNSNWVEGLFEGIRPVTSAWPLSAHE